MVSFLSSGGGGVCVKIVIDLLELGHPYQKIGNFIHCAISRLYF